MKYRVLRNIWHTKDLIYYFPGAVVKLDHLSQERIDHLIGQNVVEPIQEKSKRAEVKDGSNDRS